MSRNLEVNGVIEARLLLRLQETAEEMGLDAQSAKYFELLIDLKNEVIEKMEEIWTLEELNKGGQ